MTQNPYNPEASTGTQETSPTPNHTTPNRVTPERPGRTGRDTNTTRDLPVRRAAKTGLIITALGVLAFNVAPFLAWVTTDDAESYSGYETDSLIPFIAYLGVGLLIALVVAGGRARRGQHRGLTLVSMAVGIAAAVQCVAFAVEPMGALERGDELSIELGLWVGLIGAAIWAIGSGLLAKEIEGDDNDRTEDHLRGTKTAH